MSKNMNQPHRHLTTHRLNRPIRLTIMITLITTFFIVSPLLIFYIAGFRYDFTEHKIKQTGVLSIDILPRDAGILLNNIAINKRTPIRLANRAPGTYDLTIAKQGFKSWHKDVSIGSNQTTYINDIILIREPKPTLTKTQFEDVISIYGNQNSDIPLIMMRHDQVYEIVKYDSEKNITIPLIRTTSDDIPKIFLSPYRNLAMIRVINDTENTIHLVPLDNSESITTFTVVDVRHISWYDNWFEPLAVQTDDQIMTLSTNKNQNTIHTTDADMWYVDSDGSLWIYENTILKHIGNDEQYALEQVDEIVHINRDRIVTHAQGKLTITYRAEHTTYTIDADHTYYNADNRQLIAWTPWEVSIVYEDGTVSLINRTGDDIRDIKIFDENNTLIFLTKNGVKTFDPRYYVGYDLLPDDIDQIYINTKKRAVLYVNARDNRLYSVDFSVE